MRHTDMAGGVRQMEIDHFDPRIGGESRNKYSNLLLATGHCNKMKSDAWPTAAEGAAGMRILNPTVERDYEEHIFEDPATHELVGLTAAGNYHIDVLDLNHDTFVWERRKRAEYRSLMRQSPATVEGSFAEIEELLRIVATQFDIMIPDISPPPRDIKI